LRALSRADLPLRPIYAAAETDLCIAETDMEIFQMALRFIQIVLSIVEMALSVDQTRLAFGPPQALAPTRRAAHRHGAP